MTPRPRPRPLLNVLFGIPRLISSNLFSKSSIFLAISIKSLYLIPVEQSVVGSLFYYLCLYLLF